MTYNKIQEMIQSSQGDDWLYDEKQESFTFKSDKELQIRRTQSRPFNETWARKFSDKGSDLLEYDVYYNKTFMEKKYLVGIDGERAIVPLPTSSEELSFRDEDIHFARIINRLSRLDEYIERIQSQR